MKTSLPTSANRQSNVLRNPDEKVMRRVASNDRFLGHSSAQQGHPTADTNARYSICYLPGASEHRTLAEAQMKVVMFACEVERLTSQNYELVKENEVLRTQTDKSQREKDLENKLAIVLAENEKLNQVIEELYDMYMADKAGEAPEDYEKRISELLQDREVWKQRCQNLQNGNGDIEFQNALRAIEDENNNLKDVLVERDRELEFLRARVQAAGTPNEAGVFEERILWLVEENNQLKEEIKNIKPAGPVVDERIVKEYREKINQLIHENENLKEIITNQLEENNKERPGIRVSDINQSPVRGGGFDSRNASPERVLKAPAAQQQGTDSKVGEADKLREKIDILLNDNERLNALVQKQMSQIDEYRKTNDWFNKMKLVTDENDRLSSIVADQLDEIDRLKRLQAGNNATSGNVGGNNQRIEELNNRINTLLTKNNDLNNLVIEKDAEVEELKKRLTKDGSSEVIQELKGKLILLTNENEKLNNLVLDKVREVDQLKAQRGVPGTQVVQIGGATDPTLKWRIDDLTKERDSLLKDNENLKNLVQEKQREIDQYRLQGVDNTLKWRVDDLNREKERLSAALLDKSKEAEDIRRKYQELQVDSSNVEQLKARIVMVTDENERLNNLLLDKIRELDALRGSSSSYPYETSTYKVKEVVVNPVLKYSNVETEKQHAGGIDQPTLRGSTDQTDALKYKVQSLLGENEKLNALLNEKFKEIEELRKRNYQLEATAGSREPQTYISYSSNEADRLRALLGDKDTELLALRKRIGELEGGSFTLLELQGKFSLVSDENKRLLEELDILRRRLAQDRTAELELKVRDLQGEKELLNHLLKAKNEEAEGYRRELANLRNQHVEVVSTLNYDLSKQKEELKNAGVASLKNSTELESKAKQVYDLENKAKNLEAEVQRLNNEIFNKDTEIARLRFAAGQAESLQYRLDQANSDKSQLEATLNANYRELDTLRAKSIAVDRLEGDLQATRDSLDAVLKQSDEYRKRIYELESSSGKIRELENALEILRGESNILRRSLEEKNRTIGELEDRARNASLEKEKLAFSVEDKNRELDNLKRKHSNDLEVAKQTAGETIKLERTRSNNEKDILERRLENVTEENERVKAHLSQALLELDDLKKKFYELEHLRSQEIAEFRQQYETLKEINREIKDLQLKSAAERTAYETQLAQYQMTLDDIQRQNGLLAAENERLTALNNQRVEEVEKLRRVGVEHEESNRLQVAELKSQIEQYKATAHDIKQLAIKYSADRAADQSHIKQLQQLNDNYKAEIEKLYELMDQRKADIESAQKDNEALRQTQAQLVMRLKNGEGDDRVSNERFELLQNQLRDLEKTRNEYKDQAERNSVELTRRNRELVAKIQEVDVLKLKYEEAFANYQALNFKLFERLSL